MKNSAHSSILNKEIEKHVAEKLLEVYGISAWQKKNSYKDIINVDFDLYYFSDNKQILGEIYSGIGKLKPGSTKKIGTDILKMLAFEIIHDRKYDKHIYMICDEERIRSFEKKWVSTVCDKLDINVHYGDVQIDKELWTRLIEVHNKQSGKG